MKETVFKAARLTKSDDNGDEAKVQSRKVEFNEDAVFKIVTSKAEKLVLTVYFI